MAKASIDIGSNSMVLLVTDDHGHTLHDETAIVGLGKGLGSNAGFRMDRMDAALSAFEHFKLRCDAFGIDPSSIVSIATSASRRASNAESFFCEVHAKTGIAVTIVSGLTEAELTWKGALLGLPIEHSSYAVVDLGGGSTEIVHGDLNGGRLVQAKSLEIGTVRLTESFFGSNPQQYDTEAYAAMKVAISSHVDSVDWSHVPNAMIAVAGTATTLGAMELGLTQWDRQRVHGTKLSQDALQVWIERLLHSHPEQRVQWASVSPERAHYLLAGASVLESICAASKRTFLWVSDGGVRHGALM